MTTEFILFLKIGLDSRSCIFYICYHNLINLNNSSYISFIFQLFKKKYFADEEEIIFLLLNKKYEIIILIKLMNHI
jgi:hypothetical protein